MRGYAFTLGSAAACGIDVSVETGQVGRWMDRKYPVGTEWQGNFLTYFALLTEQSAKRQASGESNLSCSDVETSVRTKRWP